MTAAAIEIGLLLHRRMKGSVNIYFFCQKCELQIDCSSQEFEIFMPQQVLTAIKWKWAIASMYRV